MSNLGRYQELVVEAHEAGGPDAWVDSLKENSYKKGAMDTKDELAGPLLAGGAAAGAVIGVFSIIAFQKIRKWIACRKENKLLLNQKIVQAEEHLKQELNDTIEDLEVDEREGHK